MMKKVVVSDTSFIDEKPREKCGIVGLWTASNRASQFARQALASLQHRGQESSGISIINSKNKIVTYKGNGLVPHVLTASVLTKLGKSKAAIGHNRYATSGSGSVQNAQPFELKNGKYQLAIGHNGNIPDVSNIKKHLGERKAVTSDTFLAASLLLKERPNFNTWEETFMTILPEFRGAYNFVILTNDGSVFGIRDPYGIRPLCLGRLPDGWIIASESVALDSVGADYIRDVKPGEIIKIDPHGKLNSYFFGEPKRPQYCLFEYVYFARPDSFLNDRRVRHGREVSGKLLAERMKKKGIHPDVVVPTFDSGYPAAKGAATALDVPMVDAITTSHYVGRTFIQPGQDNRVAAVNGKHNIVPDEIVGKKVVIVDDSAVRLTTSKSLIQGFRDGGAKAVYFGIASPPVVNRCDLGIDMRNKKNLPASQFVKQKFEKIEENIAELIGADRVIYLPIEETTKAMGGTPRDFYHTPFGGPHPIKGKQEVFPKRKNKIEHKAKICMFISGKGTFMQDIIDSVEKGEIAAEITGVISNKRDALGITRAQKHHIPTIIAEYKGKLKDTEARKQYEEVLVNEIKRMKPDVILLTGWQMILGDAFLNAMHKMEIPVINHHPALLTDDASETITTSRGTIPVLRGGSVWQDAFDKKLPVSGLSVHQVLPGDKYDVGPVIMKSEVRIRPNDTFESWRNRMDEIEHLLVPTAMKRILHVMNHHNINIAKGEFPW